jgi:hypothetical protein
MFPSVLRDVQLGERYQYEPLVNPKQIRVLHLLSGFNETLRGRIEHVDFSNYSDGFSALSYEWGHPKKLHWIEIVGSNGEELGVIDLTNSLNVALCSLRDSSAVGTKTFWIDQICINQKNEAEVKSQVNQMGQIYKHATKVISYLGPGELFDEDGLNLMECIVMKYWPTFKTNLSLDQIWLMSSMTLSDRVDDSWIFRHDAADSTWQCLTDFVFGPSTRRLWMVQEAG